MRAPCEEWPISWELPEQISLGNDWFWADLRNVFNETRRSHTCQLSRFSRESPSFSLNLPGDFRGLFLGIVLNDILTMQRFLDISRFLYSGGWQVCALIAFTQASYRNMKSYFTICLLNMIKTNKRIRILKTHLLFKLLRRVPSLSNCMLFASHWKFCL